ncbi:MAG: IclR family transcriptional regulator [Burkholderiales bacterium]|nr:IclR family transcriptional regulator [Burkholderiales bacterium]
MSASTTLAGSAPAVLTVERGMQVLRAFRSERAPLTNAEIVRRTGLPKATVSRLTSTLIQLGFVRHVPGRRDFELATGPLAIGHAYLATSDLLPVAHPFMQDLADRLNASVALGIRDGLDILYVGYRAGHRVATLRMGVGSVLPMGHTAIGRAYLWALPAPEQKRLVGELRRNAGPKGAALERAIRDSFAELDRTGTCAVLAGFQRNTYAVALPVHIGRERTLMGFNCGKADVQPNLAVERKRIAPVLQKAAGQLEALLADIDGSP